jgi:hypothetical protein
MRNVLTADDNYNNYFYQDDAHKIEGDKHRQEVVFEKGGIATGLPKTATSPTINPEARRRQRNRLKRLTAGFLRSGGKVTVCPPGTPPNFRFGKFKSPSPSRGMTSTGELSQRRWHGPTLDARTERDLIRKAKSGDERAKQQLVEAFHRFVLSIASKHNRRRKDVGAPSLPKTSHAKATTVPKHTHRIKNLGKYAHPAKLPTGAKIGADVVKMKKPSQIQERSILIMSDQIKVSDSEALEWANQLSDQDKVELKRQALLKRAIDLAQPNEGEPNWGAMDDQTFLRVRREKYGY